MKQAFTFGAIALLVIAGVGYFITNTTETETKATSNSVPTINESAPAVADLDTVAEIAREDEASVEIMENSEMNEAVETMDDVSLPEESTSGSYQAYDPAVVAHSDAETIVLFFHAAWCPTCRALDADITANLSDIPAGTEIYKVDYDTATELKQQYGVITQHSVIEINSDGVAQSSITHPNSLDALVANL